MNGDLLDYALMYAARGWYVFPLWPGQATPLLKSPGYHLASNDLQQVAEWWTRWPEANIGINLARSGLTAFDVDPQNGGDVTHREQFPDIASPLRSYTPSGGEHHLFTVPEGVEVKGRIGTGIDGKWNGYVVLPPSRRRGVQDKRDGDYVWQCDPMTEAPELPDAMIKPPPLPVVHQLRPDVTTSLDDVGSITEALEYLADYDDFRDENWLQVGMALHHWEHNTPGAEGVGWTLFAEWSMRDPKGTFDDRSCRKRWDSLKVDRANAVTLGSIFHRAQRSGWPGAHKLSADLAAAAFGAGPREAAEWTTEPVTGFRGQQTPEEILADRMTGADWFTQAWHEGKTGKLARTLAWSTGSNCEAVLAVLLLNPAVKDTPVLRSTIAEVCRSQTEWKTITPERCKWQDEPMLPPVSTLSFVDLPVAELERTTNDHMKDAQQVQAITFANRLASFDAGVFWWTGARWQQVSRDLIGRQVARALNNPDSKVSSGRINGTVEVLANQIPIRGTVNPPSHLLFFRNCVVDSLTGAVTCHDASMGNSFLINADYEPAAECSVFLEWLHDIFATDLGRVALLQEVFGWCLISHSLGIQKAVTMVGVPRAGKGTILSLISRLLGDAAGAFQIGDLVSDKVLSGMMKRNVVIDYDASSPDSKTAREVAGKFKAITANEPVSVKIIYRQEPIEVALNCKMIVAANSVPTLWDDSGATAGRWVPLVFDKSFQGREDTGLTDRLALEMQGIAMWAVGGLRRLIEQRRFTMPVTSRDELDSQMDGSSPLDRFIEERFSVGGEGRVSEAQVWENYKLWVMDHGLELAKRRSFMKSFITASRIHGVLWKKSINIEGKYYRGFDGLKVENTKNYNNPFKIVAPPDLKL